MQAYLVDRQQINDIWPQVRKLISDACEYNGNRYNEVDYHDFLRSGEKQLWVAIDNVIVQGIAITEIAIFPRKKCCVIDIFTGGCLHELLQFLPLIEKWAKEVAQCDQIFTPTRIGLSRVLKSHGYLATHTLLEKNL
jgi:hypothetical protein